MIYEQDLNALEQKVNRLSEIDPDSTLIFGWSILDLIDEIRKLQKVAIEARYLLTKGIGSDLIPINDETRMWLTPLRNALDEWEGPL